MAKSLQIIRSEVVDPTGHVLSDSETIKLSDKQIDMLARLFAPIVLKKGSRKS